MGARGNSGVILSQLLRGIAEPLPRTEEVGPADAGRGAPAWPATWPARPWSGRSRGRSSPSPGPPATGRWPARPPAASSSTSSSGLAPPRPTPSPGRPRCSPCSPRPASSTPAATGYLLLLDALLHRARRPGPARAAGRRRAVDATAPVGPGRGLAADAPTPAGETVTDLRYEVMYFLEAPDDAIAGVQGRLGRDRRLDRRRRRRRPLELPHPHRRHRRRHRGGARRRPAAGDPRDRPRRAGRRGAMGPRGRRRARSTSRPGHRRRTAVVAVVTGDGVGRIFRSLGVHHLVPAASR